MMLGIMFLHHPVPMLMEKEASGLSGANFALSVIMTNGIENGINTVLQQVMLFSYILFHQKDVRML